MSASDAISLVVTILAFLSATLVSVLMASGPFTYMDTLVGVLLFFACLTVDRPELRRGPALITFALMFGGAMYLTFGVFIELILLRAGFEDIVYEQINGFEIGDKTIFLGDICSVDHASAVSYLNNACRELPYALTWAAFATLAFLFLLITRKPLEA